MNAGGVQRLVSRIILAVWLSIAAFVLVTTLWGVWASFTPVYFWDEWEDLPTPLSWQLGQGRISALWGLWNEHSVFFPRIVFLLDYLWLGGTNVLMVGGTVATQLFVSGLVVWETWRAGELPRASRLFLVGAGVALTMSAAQMGHFLLPYQVSFAFSFLVPIAGMSCMAMAGEPRAGTRGTWAWIAAALLCAAIGTFSISNGIFALPLLVVYAWAIRLPARFVWMTAAAGVVVIGLRLAIGFRHVATPGVGIPIWLVARNLALYLGTPLWTSVGAAYALGRVGLGLGIVVTAVGLPRLRSCSRFERFHLMVIWFNLASGAAVSLGRSDHPFDWFLTSRYAVGPLFYWASLVAFLLYTVRRLPRWRSVAEGLWSGLVMAAVVGLLLPVHRTAGQAQLEERVDREIAELAFVVGAYDQEALKGLYWLPERLLQTRSFLRDHRRTSFAQDWAMYPGQPLTSVVSVREGEGLGAFTAAERLSPPPPDVEDAPPAVRVTGWAWEDATQAPAALILLVDERGMIRGLAKPTRPRRFLSRQPPAPPERAGAWTGYALLEGEPPLRAYAVAADGRTASLLAGKYDVGAT